MKKFELIIGIISILGLIFKLLDFVGSNILIVFTFSILSFLYYLLSFALLNNIRLRDIFKKDAYKGTNAKRIIGTIGLGFAFSLILFGGLFKLELWPGSEMQLLTGLITTLIIFIIAFFFFLKNKSDFYKGIFIRIAIIGIFGLTVYFTPRNTLVDIYYRDNPEHGELLKKVLDDPENNELREQLDQLIYQEQQDRALKGQTED